MALSVIFLLIALYKEFFRPAVSFFIVIAFLNVTGVLSPSDVLSGFANEQLAVIVMLLVISDIIRKSSVVDTFFFRIMGQSKSVSPFRRRMMWVVAVFSSFFNNTPLVAMMMPHIGKWSSHNKIAQSKLLIPLSYAAILGGCVTLVGTSTNLIVNGMAVEAGFDSLNILDFAWVGLPMLVIGILYIQLFGSKLLPETDSAKGEFLEHSRDYLVETKIKANSDLIGKTVEDAGMRNLKGLFLVEILRKEELITPVSPQERLQESDALIFSGNTSAIDELNEPTLGLTLPKACEQHLKDKEVISEVVVSHNSYLIDKRVKDSDFRGKYDGAIVAVHRNGEKLSGKIGDVVLKAGDVLLLFGGKDFAKRTQGNQAFYSISESHEPEQVNVLKVGVVLIGVVVFILLARLNVVSLFTGLLLVLLAALFMRIVPLHEVRKGMDFNLIILLALGLALGKAMINSGAAEYIASSVLNFAGGLQPIGLFACLFIVTNFLSAYITNKAAIAILFPISVSLGQSLSLPIEPFILVVAFGAAANFITPIGYQTNLMVYGQGGYRFKDFFRIGLPLTLLYMVACSLILCFTYNLI